MFRHEFVLLKDRRLGAAQRNPTQARASDEQTPVGFQVVPPNLPMQMAIVIEPPVGFHVVPPNLPMQMAIVIEPPNLPQIRIKPILIRTMPARLIDPKLKQPRIVGLQPPGPVATQQLRDQMLNNPAMANHPNPIAVAMAIDNLIHKPFRAIARILKGLRLRYGDPILGGLKLTTEFWVASLGFEPGQPLEYAILVLGQLLRIGDGDRLLENGGDHAVGVGLIADNARDGFRGKGRQEDAGGLEGALKGAGVDMGGAPVFHLESLGQSGGLVTAKLCQFVVAMALHPFLDVSRRLGVADEQQLERVKHRQSGGETIRCQEFMRVRMEFYKCFAKGISQFFSDLPLYNNRRERIRSRAQSDCLA
jgi:hypothetical protein